MSHKVIGKIIALLLILSTSLLTGCMETTEVTKTEETISMTYELEGDSIEDILAQMEDIPDEIEINGKIYKRVEQHVLEEGEVAEEGATTITENYVLTDDPLLLYKEQILSVMRASYVYVLSGLAALILILAAIVVLKRRWQLWY